jgi:serine/threonine protein kinase
MNAEALVGKRLDSYMLRRVIGVGSMGAVYLARQSQSHQQFVLKVFLHASSLEPLQYIDFLLRFRKEMELVASLNHPHILSVLEYEERDGLVYLVMPYIHVRSLESVLNSHKVLSLQEIADYLDQLAGALDYAHEHEVLHLDIKPSNILISVDDSLLLSDFALTKTMTDRQAARIREFKTGMLDYMSPELVMGKEPGEKADLYSLGAVLYRMVTGSAPFQGATMVEVAKKQLQETPPLPRSKRPDLPLAVEQVILRAMSKRPGHRFSKAQDLASAFRFALEMSASESDSSGIYPSYSLFNPQRNPEFSPVRENEPVTGQTETALATAASTTPTGSLVSVKNLPVPTRPEPLERPSSSFHAVHFEPIIPTQDPQMFPEPGTIFSHRPAMPIQDSFEISEQQSDPGGVVTIHPVEDARAFAQQNALSNSSTAAPEAITPASDARLFPQQNQNALIATLDPDPATTGTIMKLTSPAKVVNVPVAGQPGRYVVGLMPVPEVAQPEGPPQPPATSKTDYLKKNAKIIGLGLLIIFLLGTGTLWFVHQRANTNAPVVTIKKTPDLKATTIAQATATAEANIILSDPMASNIHNWPLMTSGSMQYVFKDGAYHITDNDNNRGAPAILSGVPLPSSFVYTLTMEEIKGDDTSVNNEFGMIFRATIVNKNGKTITRFYSLEVVNESGGEYQFWKYDDSQGPNSNLWLKISSHQFGNEFHVGHGPKSINTFKLIANGKNFTLVVNGKKAWTFQDGSFANGGVGMLVNLEGTEVAFSNLLLTHS